MTREDDLPPRYFGDHPHGAYWSADPLPGDQDAEEVPHVPKGSIRFSWDYGVRVPLWDDTGLLPEDPAWLREAFGLDDALVHDLTQWGHDMNALDDDPRLRTMSAYEALDARARDLVARLERVIGDRFVVEYHPWVVLPD